MTIEPELPNGSAKRPDFLAVTPAGEPVYVEAKLAFEEGLPERVAQRQVNEIYAAIEKLRCPNFSINVEVVAQSAVQPGGGTLRKHLREWIATLDPDTEFQKIAASRNLDDLPTTQWQHEDWIIDFEAMARPPERRDEARRVVGIQTGSAYLMNSWKPIRRAIEKKGGRYDLLPHPLLVAVNLNNFSIDPADEMQALFGQDEVAVYREGDSFLPTVQRKADGVWVGKFTRVSGAWVFADVTPWNVARQRSTVYFNPWAVKPLPSLFSTLHQAAAEGNEMQWKEGRSMREVLGLPEDWPRSNG